MNLISDSEIVREEPVHKRRVRYKGRYPRSFKEKYKELQPEKYADTIDKVIRKGSTPAGMHIPIMVHEILDVLQIQPGMQGMDATLGYGGHTLAMLQKLEQQGHLYATDVDPIESAKTKERLRANGYGEGIFSVRLMNFAQIDTLVQEVGQFDFILADLGVSSMQIDNPERGFSYKHDGPLDLRLNPQAGISAAARLQELSKDELQGMLMENADEPFANEIARCITKDLQHGIVIATTAALHAEVEKALSHLPEEERHEAVRKSSARTFQALRIDVNREFESLYAFMSKLPEALKPSGRVAVLTFHSGEDRLVKQAFREFYRQGIYSDIAKEVVRPSAKECARNSRAHSTKLRWAVKA
jgi:16S rRNA (cytosine1402-N4)-methyltransferase